MFSAAGARVSHVLVDAHCRVPFRGSNQLFTCCSCLQECRMELNAEVLLNNTSWSGSDISYPEHISCVVCSRNCNDNFDNFDTEGGVGFNHVQQPWQPSFTRLKKAKRKVNKANRKKQKTQEYAIPDSFRFPTASLTTVGKIHNQTLDGCKCYIFGSLLVHS